MRLMRNLRLHWDAQAGWYLDVPAALSRPALQRVIDWALPRQIDRWRSLPVGDRRDQLATAIQQLQDGLVEQRLVGSRGDGQGDLVMFQATRPQEDRKIISVGAI